MLSRIYKLSFYTPVRFGRISSASSLNFLHADTFFSALYIELMKCGKDKQLLDAVQKGELLISDGMPFENTKLYLPRPVGLYPKKSNVETDPGLRKLFKKIQQS